MCACVVTRQFTQQLVCIILGMGSAYERRRYIVTSSFTGLAHVQNNPSWYAWWRHQMETFSALLAICAENSPVPVNSPHKGQWRGALMFSLIRARINGWVNNREAGDLRRHQAHCDVIVMYTIFHKDCTPFWCALCQFDSLSHGRCTKIL